MVQEMAKKSSSRKRQLNVLKTEINAFSFFLALNTLLYVAEGGKMAVFCKSGNVGSYQPAYSENMNFLYCPVNSKFGSNRSEIKECF